MFRYVLSVFYFHIDRLFSANYNFLVILKRKGVARAIWDSKKVCGIVKNNCKKGGKLCVN